MTPSHAHRAATGAPSGGRLWPAAALMVAMVSIQGGASLAKGLFPLVGAEGATTLRLVIGGLILSAVLRPWRARPSRAIWPALLGYGVAIGAMNLAFYMSLRTLPLGVAVALEFTGPMAVAALASRRRVDFAWIGLASFGLLLLSPFLRAARPLDPLGVAWALGAGLCWALYIVFAKRAGRELGAATTALGTLIAAVIVLPLGLAHAGSALWAPPILIVALLVGLFSSALPFSLEMVALTRLPTPLYGTLTSLEPVLGAMVGRVWLHESLTAPQWLGVLAIVAGAAGAVATRPPPPGLV